MQKERGAVNQKDYESVRIKTEKKIKVMENRLQKVGNCTNLYLDIC